MLCRKLSLILLALCVASQLASSATVAVENVASANPLVRLKSALVDCTQRASKAVHAYIKPKVEYFQLAKRFNTWQRKYKSLEAGSAGDDTKLYMKAGELVSKMFGQVDNEMYMEMEERELAAGRKDEKGQLEVNQQLIENTDYLYEVLKRLVDRLEQINELVEVGEEEEQPEVKEESSRLSAEAMERAKRIAMFKARDFLAVELLQVSRMAALNAFAAYLQSSPPSADSPLAAIAPIILMLGNPSASLASTYLTSLKIRHVIDWMDALNPVPNLVSSVFGRMASTTCKRTRTN